MCGRVVGRVRVVVIAVALCEASGVQASIHCSQVVVATLVVLMLVEAGHTVRACKWALSRWAGDGAVMATFRKSLVGRQKRASARGSCAQVVLAGTVLSGQRGGRGESSAQSCAPVSSQEWMARVGKGV